MNVFGHFLFLFIHFLCPPPSSLSLVYTWLLSAGVCLTHRLNNLLSPNEISVALMKPLMRLHGSRLLLHNHTDTQRHTQPNTHIHMYAHRNIQKQFFNPLHAYNKWGHYIQTKVGICSNTHTYNRSADVPPLQTAMHCVNHPMVSSFELNRSARSHQID